MNGDRSPSRSTAAAHTAEVSLLHTTPLCATSVHQHKATVALRHKITTFLCRLDVCWTLFFFVFLVATAAITTAVTETLISRSLLETWHAIHFIRIRSITKRIVASTDSAATMANAFQSIHLQEKLNVTAEHTISLLCASLDRYDIDILFRAFVLVTVAEFNVAGCFHDLAETGSPSTLEAYVTSPGMVNGSFLIDPATYTLVRPLVMTKEWPPSARNVTRSVLNVYSNYTLLPLAEAFYNGTIDSIDPREFWTYPPTMPHLILYTLPLGVVARGVNLLLDQHLTDFVQVRLDGSQLLIDYDTIKSTDFAAAAFIEQSLQDSDPQVLSNNWGQPSVDNTSIYAVTANLSVTYLRVSAIASPLMREALRHVRLGVLQHEGHNRTADFQYNGAPATVTAVHVTLDSGLRVPLVFVSRQADRAGPYRRIMDICNGVNAAVIVLLTALFWWLAHTCFSTPLERMTALLLASLVTGRRAVFARGAVGACVEVREVRQLAAAHNAMMRQLRDIDAFVPVAVRELLRRGCAVTTAPGSLTSASLTLVPRKPRRVDSLCNQPATLVYVMVRRRGGCGGGGAAVSTLANLPAFAEATGGGPRRKAQRLSAVVEQAARAAEMVNSGPFPTPAALEAFVTAVLALCERHGGVVQLLCPDACLLRFGAHARQRLLLLSRRRRASASDSGGDVMAAQDALAAVGFMLDLQSWVDAQAAQEPEAAAPCVPDVRCLADSGRFVCGNYRPRGSEQTLTVALGRDVQRKVGHVPAAIGVRTAVTEETAVLVHPLGVRVLPVAALRVGRPRLSEDVVVLYEALPGATAGNAPWLEYARCCCAGFECMVRGDYAAALRAFRDIAGIADLEPGLLPSSLSREAARTDAVGGAVSVQVKRLVRECERRVRDGCHSTFLHVRHVPLGIDAVLEGVSRETVTRVRARSGGGSRRSASASTRSPEGWGGSAVLRDGRDARQRHLVTLYAGVTPVRCVVGDPPPCIADQHGMLWRLPAGVSAVAQERNRRAHFTVLGTAGTLCTAVFYAFRDVPPVIAKAVRGVPDGPLSAALRSAVPVWDASSAQRALLARLLATHRSHQHPNLMRPVGYSLSVEGGVVGLWECCRGGCMRELVARYTTTSPVVFARHGLCVLSALSHLHSRGLVHGSLSVDSVVVGADGVCRLIHHTADPVATSQLLVLQHMYYVSPAMAAGHPPTPACDMFCYGLLSLEAVTRQPPWAWAAVAEGCEPHGTPEELAALMRQGGAAFSAAVVEGRVVPNTAVLEPGGAAGHYSDLARETVRRCVAMDPQLRPTAEEVREVNKALLRDAGLMVEE